MCAPPSSMCAVFFHQTREGKKKFSFVVAAVVANKSIDWYDPITNFLFRILFSFLSSSSSSLFRILLLLLLLRLTRYYAIVKPLKYPMTITKKVVAIMILNTWISPALLSFIPIFAGWYTTEEHKEYIRNHPELCEFEVNRVYAVISSSISFWIPCTIMIFTYLAIFREANRQEKQLAMRQGNAMLMHRHSSAGGTNGLCDFMQNILFLTVKFILRKMYFHFFLNFCAGEALSGSGSSKMLTLNEVDQDHSTPTKDKHLIKMKREHKAARTLGIIMGTFILCWLPFFVWYATNITLLPLFPIVLLAASQRNANFSLFSFSNICTTVQFQVYNGVWYMWTKELSFTRYSSRNTFLDWILQFNAESSHLCILQSWLPRRFQKYIKLSILCVVARRSIGSGQSTFKFTVW